MDARTISALLSESRVKGEIEGEAYAGDQWKDKERAKNKRFQHDNPRQSFC
jgi:hypothetical protein